MQLLQYFRVLPSNAADYAKKLRNFLCDMLKMTETPVEKKLESYSGRNSCADNDQSLIKSSTSNVDHKWSSRTEDLDIGNDKNNVREKQSNADISDHLLNNSPQLHMQRTEIIHIESPAKFYIKNPNAEINQMELNKYANTTTFASTVDMNTLYLVQKSNDMNWYRAKVSRNRNGTEFLMIFIDHGFKHIVNRSK